MERSKNTGLLFATVLQVSIQWTEDIRHHDLGIQYTPAEPRSVIGQ